MNEGNIEFLHITSIIHGSKKVVEILPTFSIGLYYTKITVWHDRLGHPGSTMMQKIITNSCGHPLKNQKILPNDYSCAACSQGKLIIRPSPAKIIHESINFLERIQGDICGPIHPPCGTFRYFMVLIDASTNGHMFLCYQLATWHLRDCLLN